MAQQLRGTEAIDAAMKWVAGSHRVMAFTGAGISTASGVPDFRGPNGLWTRHPDAERASNIRTYVTDEKVRRASWQAAADRVANPDVKPNIGHRALVHLESAGKLLGVATQNVDGFHVSAGHQNGRVFELHGTWKFTMCLTCGDRQPVEIAVERVRAGELDPKCSVCEGMLKRDVVLFGESLPADVFRAADEMARSCDVMLAIGSTLGVTPAAYIVDTAVAAGAKLVIINQGATERDRYADAIIDADISELLPLLTGYTGG